MDALDQRLISLVQQMAGHSPIIIYAAGAIAKMDLVKGTVLISLLWWIWFRRRDSTASISELKIRDREIVVIAIASGLAALVAGRLLAYYLPFRLRPIFEPQLRALYPDAMPPELLLPRTWSAFPSDHAMLWCAIAAAIFFASPAAGGYALLHTAMLICLPRIYLGLHYPTDVLAGAAIGIGIACVLNATPICKRLAAPILRLAADLPGPFYALAFVLSFEFATQFDELRAVARGLSKAVFGGF
jgi:membrane-associated phospholipid phosphatase